MARSKILVIDDDGLMREYVHETLSRVGYEVHTESTGRAGMDAAASQDFDVVVSDLKMTPPDGLEVLRHVIEHCPGTHCVIMTAYGTVETAVTALKLGAADYIMKPFAPDELELTIERVLRQERLTRENAYLRQELEAPYAHGAMIGDGPAMAAVYDQIRKVAGSRATVLIRGESGTGKELVARAIHHGGARRDRPFVKVNCAALSAGLLESELFGHERGAFTGAHERKIGRFELAHEGTLLLDEVSEISSELQPKLLRALQEREIERVGGTSPIQIDTHIIATSNRDLEAAVAEGGFREDLFFRLNVITIHLPPLRQRPEDIPALTDFFLERFVRENGRRITGVSEEARSMLRQYRWPGNVRELQNAVERAVVLSSESVLEPRHFALDGPARGGRAEDGGVCVPVGTTVAEMEKTLILTTLEACGQNRTHAAGKLGISVRTLRNKLNEYAAV